MFARRDYEQLFKTIVQADGKWVRIAPDAVAGRSPQAKRQTLHSAALYRGLKLRTSIKGGLAAALSVEPATLPIADIPPYGTPVDASEFWHRQ